MKKVVVSFAIPEKIKVAFESHCKKRGESRSAVITRVLYNEIGDSSTDKIYLKNSHTFHIFCDSWMINAVLHGAKKNKLTPEGYIKHCIVNDIKSGE